MESARSPALHSAVPPPAIRTAQSACDVPAVLCLRVSVSGGTSDGHIVLAGLGLSQGDTSGDATPLYSALGVSEAEMDLKPVSSQWLSCRSHRIYRSDGP